MQGTLMADPRNYAQEILSDGTLFTIRAIRGDYGPFADGDRYGSRRL
jgi:hypothetical protein